MKELKAHPIADIFPMMADNDLRDLAADIGDNGLREPIYLYDEQILDGRNRFKACGLAGIDPEFKEYKGKEPLAFVLSKNLRRRHLTESQRSMVASKIASLDQGRKSNVEISTFAKTQKEAANSLNVSRESVVKARHVIEDGIPELVEAVESGAVAVSAAAEVAKLPKSDQKKIVKAGPKAVRESAKTSRQAKKNAGTNGVHKPVKQSDDVPDDKPTAVQVDGWGIPIQPHAEAAFATIPQFKEFIKTVRQFQKQLHELADGPGGQFLRKRMQGVRRPTKDEPNGFRWEFDGLKNVIYLLEDCTPTYTVCPYMHNDERDHPDPCPTCWQQNWTGKLSVSAISPSLIALAKKHYGVTEDDSV